MQLVELLITTYGKTRQEILEILEGIQLRSNCIIRNQTNASGQEKININGYEVTIINAVDKGLSKNRNELLKLSDAEYVMFCDDDTVFVDDYIREIEKAKSQKHDGIMFNVLSLNNNRPLKQIKHNKICNSFFEISSNGICGLAIKKSFLLNNSLWFEERIGSGTDYPCGEDSLFLKAVLKCGGRIVLNKKTLLTVSQQSSLWYQDIIDEKLLLTKGIVYKQLYGNLWAIFALRFISHNRKRIGVSKPFSIIKQGTKISF